MYEAYIEARDSTWRDMKRMIIVWTGIWLVECSPSLRSECMVFPYIKGFDNKEEFLSIYILLFLGYFYYHNIFGLELQQVVSEL